VGSKAAGADLAERLAGLSPERLLLLARRNPLSFAQERLWFLDRLHGGSPFYNGALRIDFEGELCMPALQAVLSEIVRRHEILRSAFLEVDGLPLQVVAAPAPLVTAIVDLERLDEARSGEILARLEREQVRQPFDLSAAPLLRALLVRRTGCRHALLLTTHHIAADRWSSRILVREVQALYRAFAAGRSSPLAAMVLQYSDFAAWQRHAARGGALEADLAYWTRQLEGAPMLLELPTDRSRPKTESFRGARVRRPLPSSLCRGLRTLGRRLQVTDFMMLLAAFMAVLHRSGGQEDILAGTSIDHRSRVELESLIGLFLNTVILRTRLSGGLEVRRLLEQTRQTVLEAHEHCDLPFEKLVEALQPERALSGNPLFQVEINLLPAPERRLDLPGLVAEVRTVDRETAVYDLVLFVEQNDGELVAFLEFNTDLFDRTTGLRLLAHLERLLEGMVEDPDRPISALPLLLEAERHQLLAEWMSAPPPDRRPQAGLQRLFEAQAALRPNAVAATCGELAFTYGELNRQANRLAWWLRANGMGLERRVAVLGERGLDLLTAILGLAKAGAVYVPLEPGNPDLRLAAILADCQPALLITQADMAGRALKLAAGLPEPLRVLCWDEAPVGLGLPDRRELAAQPDADPPEGATPQALANVFYTSGSTGGPKGAMVEHQGMLNHLWAKVERLGLHAGSVVAQNASMGFDISAWQFLAALLAGGRVVVYDEAAGMDAGSFLARVEGDGITALETVPTLLDLMLAAAPAEVSLPRLAWLISNAETLPVALCRRWSERFPHVPLVNTYGATECSDDVTHQVFRTPPPADAPRAGVGRAIPEMGVFVLDRELEPVPAGVSGQLAFHGVGVGRGYLGDPVKTAVAFMPDPLTARPGSRLYLTGDLGRLTPAGTVEFLGRIDHQVKLRGLRVELGEVEEALCRHPAVREGVVVLRRDGPGEGRLVAYSVCERGTGPTADELRAFLRARLPEHMVPSAFVALDALPLTPNGKVDRRALPAPAFVPEASEAGFLAPSGPVEEIVTALWCEVLGREQVGARDDFFELGGHSLLAMQVMSRLRSAFAVEVPLRALFESPTPAGLAAAVERRMKAGGADDEAPPIVPVPRTGPMLASFAQQRLWFLDQLEPGSPAYNLPLAVSYRGSLHPALLAAGLAEVVWRHEALRTVLQAVDGEVVQVILPAGPVPLPVVDLEALPAVRREGEVRRALAEEGLRPFDLGSGPLLRVFLLRLGAREHVLLATMHHAVSDGWSMEIFRGELEVLYGALRRSEPSPLAALPVQYADFAVWQRRWLAGAALADQLSYWRQRLAGAPPVLELPTDRPRPAVRSYRGAMRRWDLPPGLTGSLLRLSRQRSATVFMTLLAGFQFLLARYSGQTDVVVGTPVAGRTRLELEGLIGFFVNTLVLRGDLAGDPAFSDLISRVRETALGAYAYQDLPFERLVEELSPERSLAYSPLFQVMFALENTPRSRADGASGLESRAFEPDGGAAKLDLILALFEMEGRLEGGLNYSVELFDGVTIERLTGHLEILLAAAVADPGQRMSGLLLLTAAERHQLLEWNDTVAAFPRASCLHELIAEQVRRTPEAVAVVCRGEALRFRELEERANRLAHRLRGWGAGPEVCVAICLERSLDLVVALLGVLKAGGVYVPLDPAYPHERLAFTLADAGAPVLLTQESLLGVLPELPAGRGPRVACIDRMREDLTGVPADAPASGVGPSNLAYLIYTSGSTGRPKAVAIQHESAVVLMRWARHVFSDEELSGVLASTSICFDLSVFELFVPLCHGGCVILAGSALELAGLPEAASVTLVNTVPSALAELVRLGALPGFLRTVCLAGEPLPRSLVEQLYLCSSVGRVLNLYGPSEDTTYSTFTVVPRGALPTIGRPVSGTRAHVLGPSLSPCPVGVPGDLHLAGHGLARGYLNRPELTAQSFVPDPFAVEPGDRLYRTGDLVRSRPDGELEFLGRVDHQVKIRGFRIEPGEIEAVLSGHPAVRHTVVVPWMEEAGVGRLIAYVTSADADLEISELRRFLTERLPGFMVPSAFVTLAELPLTPNGKVDRRALPAPGRSAAVLEASGEIPCTAVEEMVAAVWEQVLKVAPVGRLDNFFEIGGHSLLAIRVLSRIREAFGVEVAVRRLFEEPTVEGLAEAVEAALRAREGTRMPPPIERLPRPGELPLSFAQQRLWFIEQLEPGSPAYTLSGAVRLRGNLEVAALERSFTEIVRRHEALRARFTEVEGRPVQSISPDLHPGFPVADLSFLPEGERESAVRRLVAAEAVRPFDLGRGPLLRLLLLRLGEGEHVLVLAMHHIVSDAWSLQVLLRELCDLYPALAAGRPSSLPELPVQYADFAAWQRRWLSGEVLERHLAYWRRKLTGMSPLQLSADHLRTDGSPQGDLRRLHLSPELREDLQDLGRREGATLFMTLLAGFAIVLHEWSGQEDVTVGADIANRTRGETEGLIGFFINMLALRTDLSRNPSFRQLLGRVRETALGAYAHQDLPFERLVEELQPERRAGHSPLFQVVFNFNNTHEAGRTGGLGHLGSLDLEPVEVEQVTVRFELALLMREIPEGLEALWLFDRGLFAGATIKRMHRRLEEVFEMAVADPTARLSRLVGEGECWRREAEEREADRRRKLWQVKPVPVHVQQADGGFSPIDS
jgi:amino acid adenylation domain-containing protein